MLSAYLHLAGSAMVFAIWVSQNKEDSRLGVAVQALLSLTWPIFVPAVILWVIHKIYIKPKLPRRNT